MARFVFPSQSQVQNLTKKLHGNILVCTTETCFISLIFQELTFKWKTSENFLSFALLEAENKSNHYCTAIFHVLSSDFQYMWIVDIRSFNSFKFEYKCLKRAFLNDHFIL